jgi:hypothetical protein
VNVTTQEAYEQIRAWFSRGDATLAFDAGYDKCFYRLHSDVDSPVRCAVGCLIPDELYDEQLDDNNMHVGTAIAYSPEISELLSDVSADFLSRAQRAHDETAKAGGTPAQFVSWLDDIAVAHKLKAAA